MFAKREHWSYDHGKIMWQVELNENWSMDQWKAIRMKGFNIIPTTKMQWFQFQILSKKLVTNVMRNRWDRQNTEKCTFCKEKPETILHLLWDCTLVQDFWEKLRKWLKYICHLQPVINAKIVVINQSEDEFIDLVILIAKQYIYAAKCMGETTQNKHTIRKST